METSNTEKRSTSKVVTQDGTVSVEKSITKKIGENYVKVSVGVTAPIDAFNSKKERVDSMERVKHTTTHISAFIDETIDEELETLM